MSRLISNSVVLTVFSILCSSSGYGAEIKLSPISADGSHSINGQTIQLQGGNQRIVLELKLLDWDPDLIGTPLLRAYQAIINSCGYGIEDSICNGGIRDGECCVTDGTCAGGTCENPGVILSPAVETCT